jgi:hypothetical protein
LRNSSGSLAMFAAILRASSLLSNLAAERRPSLLSLSAFPLALDVLDYQLIFRQVEVWIIDWDVKRQTRFYDFRRANCLNGFRY